MCKVGKFKTGDLLPYKIPDSDRLVLNFPTKRHWRSSSKFEYVQTFDQKGITSISFPMLGSSNGGLDWETQVKHLMEKHQKDLPIKVIIHGYASYSD